MMGEIVCLTGWHNQERDIGASHTIYHAVDRVIAANCNKHIYTFTTDKGTTFFLAEWVVNPDSDGNNQGETVTGWGRLAKSNEAEEGEAQLRITPDGSRFYASYLEEGPGGNDILFRRFTPKEFPGNTVSAP